MYGVPPYGYNYLSPALAVPTPFITAADGNNGQRFQRFRLLNASPKPGDQHQWSSSR